MGQQLEKDRLEGPIHCLFWGRNGSSLCEHVETLLDEISSVPYALFGHALSVLRVGCEAQALRAFVQ